MEGNRRFLRGGNCLFPLILSSVDQSVRMSYLKKKIRRRVLGIFFSIHGVSEHKVATIWIEIFQKYPLFMQLLRRVKKRSVKQKWKKDCTCWGLRKFWNKIFALVSDMTVAFLTEKTANTLAYSQLFITWPRIKSVL